MKELVIKRWINGEFHEVERIELSKVKQIQHLVVGFRVVLDGYIKDYDSTQIVLEFA